MKRIFIIAGEQSGDNHGSSLIKSIKEFDSSIDFVGIGGEKMISVGLKTIENIKKLSVMGFIEVIKHLPFFKKLMNRVLETINTMKPDHIILIDYPGFNLRLAKQVKLKFNIPITYYISPQIWAWKEGRIELIKEYIDQLLVIFPFEKEWYIHRGVDVKYVGHPIYDNMKFYDRKTLCSYLNLNEKRKIITLYPGSRKQELKRHLKLFVNIAIGLKKKYPDIQFILGLARNLEINNYYLPTWIDVETNNPERALEVADLAIVASGTSTLEAAVFKTPMIIIYKMAMLSWFLSKIFVKTKYAGMVNLIAEKKIMPEFLQYDAKAKLIINKASIVLDDEKQLKNMHQELDTVCKKLGGQGASKRAAKYILSY